MVVPGGRDGLLDMHAGHRELSTGQGLDRQCERIVLGDDHQPCHVDQVSSAIAAAPRGEGAVQRERRAAIPGKLATTADGQAARVAAGIPGTTQLSKSCTSTPPPCSAMSPAPRPPSSPLPPTTPPTPFIPPPPPDPT